MRKAKQKEIVACTLLYYWYNQVYQQLAYIKKKWQQICILLMAYTAYVWLLGRFKSHALINCVMCMCDIRYYSSDYLL